MMLGIEGVSHGRHGWEQPAAAVKLLASLSARLLAAC